MIQKTYIITWALCMCRRHALRAGAHLFPRLNRVRGCYATNFARHFANRTCRNVQLDSTREKCCIHDLFSLNMKIPARTKQLPSLSSIFISRYHCIAINLFSRRQLFGASHVVATRQPWMTRRKKRSSKLLKLMETLCDT